MKTNARTVPCLELSTAHLTPSDIALLDKAAQSQESIPVTVAKFYAGWFVHTMDTTDETYVGEMEKAGFSTTFIGLCVDLDETRKGTWILFDQDAGQIDFYPTFNH